jgi:uncharacterized protein (DUF1499 family)
MNGFVVFLFIIMILGCSAYRPLNLGITDGKLSPCPDSPNCVSSQSSDKRHFIEPLRYEGTKHEAMERLIDVIQGMKRCRIITMDDHYIHAEFTSAFFRFVDDVEFYFDSEAKVIHMRSASRTGNSDFGVNRQRMEKVRSLFNNSVSSPRE